jgi:antibiotic biosynthesis monooxygenase (ABM) superfamily enzyme
MISCYVRYTIDPDQVDAFEAYARAWISLVNSMGGTHHGYFLPVEGSDEAVALFSFASMEDYQAYRHRRKEDPRCKAAFAIAENTKCIVNYEGRFMRPILPEAI